MKMDQKLDLNCSICGNPFKCDPRHANDPKCHKCLRISSHTMANAPKVIKKEYEASYEFNFESQTAKIRAVMAQGEVFAAQAGPDLMITEFVENAFDAIKKRKVINAIPIALKQMNVEPSLKELGYDRHTLPANDFNQKYTKLSNEQKTFLKNLWDEICVVIKQQSTEKSIVIVEIDEEKRLVRIVDCGTGVQYPIHISQKPFVSLKTGEDYSTGQFGRGSQVFRAFCEVMEFSSLRESPSSEELDEFKKKGWDQNAINSTKSVKITFPHDYPGGKIDWKFSSSDYKKLSGTSETGTVVTLDLWKENYFNELKKSVKTKLVPRLEHHFGFALDDMFNISLKIKHNKKDIDITKIDFDEMAKPENLAFKIDAKFDLPDMELKDKNGNSCGKIKFQIHKTQRSYSHPFKPPFLVVNGRPLGDTSIFQIPELQSYTDIWKASTITGCVFCDEVELNEMRTGLRPNTARQPFFDSMRAASITLKSLNSAWKNELSSAQDQEMAKDVVQTVSRYLSKKGIKFNFKNPLQKGAQKNSNNKSGEEITEERVSNEAGGPNQGLIDSKDGEEVIVGYRKTKVQPGDENTWDPNTIIVPHGSKKKDGNTLIKVKVKKSLVSKGGRKVRKSYSGPNLEFNVDEDSENQLSYFENDPPTVWIQSEHQAWRKLVKKAREQTNAEKFEKEKKEYLMERYLWEIINHEKTFDKDMTDEKRKDIFWTYYHDLLDTK